MRFSLILASRMTNVTNMADDARSLRLDDGRVLAWDEWGNPGGFPILYAHGTPGSGREAQLLDHAARDLDLWIIAPHRPGYGGSTHLPGRSVLEWAEDAHVLADHLGLDRLALLGFSGGGPHAIAFALRYPSRVSAAGLIASAGAPSGPGALLARLGWSVGMPALAALLGLPRVVGLPSAGRRAVARFKSSRRTNRVASIVAESLDTAVGQGPSGLRGAIRDSWAIYAPWAKYLNWNPPHTPQFLLWHGADDTTVKPDISHRLSKALAGSKLTILPGVGHMDALTDHAAQILTELKEAAVGDRRLGN